MDVIYGYGFSQWIFDFSLLSDDFRSFKDFSLNFFFKDFEIRFSLSLRIKLSFTKIHIQKVYSKSKNSVSKRNWTSMFWYPRVAPKKKATKSLVRVKEHIFDGEFDLLLSLSSHIFFSHSSFSKCEKFTKYNPALCCCCCFSFHSFVQANYKYLNEIWVALNDVCIVEIKLL